jgi:outer membrane receptor protein involved in Fe transport
MTKIFQSEMHDAKRARVKALLFGALLLTGGALTPNVGQAQTAGPAKASDKDAAKDPMEFVVVTGSRIPRREIEQPTPIQVIGSSTFTAIGTGDVGQVLAQQPAVSFGGTQQAQQNTGTAGTPGQYTGGLSEVNLRGLGTNRTLTLVNGKRQVGGDPGNTAFDLNTISSNDIQRVEVITGGASAIYGSDAVTGVVNIITRDNFQGLEAKLRASRSEYGSPGQTQGVSLTGGTEFLNGRGHVVTSFSWEHTDALQASQQPEHLNYNTIANPAYTPTNGQPNTLLVPYVQSAQFYHGGVLNYSGTTLQPGGIPFGADGLRSTFPTATGLGTLAIYRSFSGPCELCFKVDDWYTLVPELDKYIGSARARYDVLTGAGFTATAYADFRYARRTSTGNGQPINSSTTINIAQNPFLDSSVRTQLQATGATTAAFTKLWSSLGGRGSTATRETSQFNTGVKGEWATSLTDLKYDAYFSFGKTSNSYLTYNNVYAANLAAGLDSVTDPATGQAACRVNVPSLQPRGYVAPAVVGGPSACVPINPFGTSVSAAARSFATLNVRDTGTLDEAVGGLSLRGDSDKFLHFIGGAPLRFATGYEFRKETDKLTFDPREAFTTGGSTGVNSSAAYDVSEAFAELDLPLIQDKPFAKLLSFDTAGRYADYSHAGAVESYKLDGIWAPIEDFRFRGTYSRAVRAPNLTEEFSPVQTTNGIGTDPCTTVLRNASVTRQNNCTALGIPTVFAGRSTAIPLITSGNLALKPEKGDSYTVGFVFTPTFLKPLTFSVDYYTIKIRDAISLLTAVQIANACVDAVGGPDPTFCNLTTRDTNRASPTYLQLTSATSTYLNASKLRDQGYDFQASYGFTAFGGDVGLKVVATKLILRRLYLFQSVPNQYTKLDGYLGNPTWKVNPSVSYAIGPFEFTLSGRYQNKQSQIDLSPGQNPNFQDIKDVPSKYYQDLYASYQFGFGGRENYTAFAGATNLFGSKLPPITASLRNLNSGFDQQGRVIFMGLKVGL